MLIFLEYSFILKSLYIYCLFNLICASLNKFAPEYKLVAFSIFGGVILSVVSYTAANDGMINILTLITIISLVFVLLKPKRFYDFAVQSWLSALLLFLKSGLSICFKKLLFCFVPLTLSWLVAYYLLFAVLCFIITIVLVVSFRVIYQKKLIMDFVYDMSIILGDKTYNFKMLLDSGNTLMDDSSGLPIIVCSKQAIEKSGMDLSGINFKQVEYLTLNGFCSTMNIFKPDKIYIITNKEDKPINALIGLTDKKFKFYDGLLHLLTI